MRLNHFPEIKICVKAAKDLTLRPLSNADIPEFARIRADQSVAECLSHDRLNRSEAARIGQWLTTFSDEDWLTWGIGLAAILEQPSNQFIGYCGLHWIDSLCKFEICYMLAPNYWGRGIASACVGTVVEYVRAHAICDQIIGLVSADNFKSKKVLLRNGFVFRCTIPDGSIELDYFFLDLLCSQQV